MSGVYTYKLSSSIRSPLPYFHLKTLSHFRLLLLSPKTSFSLNLVLRLRRWIKRLTGTRSKSGRVTEYPITLKLFENIRFVQSFVDRGSFQLFVGTHFSSPHLPPPSSSESILGFGTVFHHSSGDRYPERSFPSNSWMILVRIRYLGV